MKAVEYSSLKEYKEANKKAHEICLKLKGYTSPMYAHENGLLTINDTYLLVLVPQFEKELKKADFVFKEYKETYLKSSSSTLK